MKVTVSTGQLHGKSNFNLRKTYLSSKDRKMRHNCFQKETEEFYERKDSEAIINTKTINITELAEL